jgi:hypothetical protein
MKVPRLAVALLAVGASLWPLASATALSVPKATVLALPRPNAGLNQGYLPFQSCSSLGNCAVTGIYLAARGYVAGVINTEVRGVWRAPVDVTPPKGYSALKGVTMEGVACPANGSCVALGQYAAGTNQLPFIVSDVTTTWHRGVALALPANAATTGQYATPHSISCVSPGNCTVVGTYTTPSSSYGTEGFVLSELKGVWHRALEVALPAGVNKNPLVTLAQVSCWSPRSCVAVGSFVDRNNVSRAMVVPEVHGSWRRALALGLPGNASAYAGAQFNEVACSAAGSCLAAGTYNTYTGAVQPLVALSDHGVWDRALQVILPDRAKNPQTLLYGFKGVACVSTGNCALGGQYVDKSGHYQGFLDNVVNGVVEHAHVLALPSGAVQAGHNGGVVSVSCPSLGTCVAGAAYLSSTNSYVALLVKETNDVWSPGVDVTLPNGSQTVGVAGGIYSVQCFSASSCQVSGSYASSATRYDGFALLSGA